MMEKRMKKSGIVLTNRLKAMVAAILLALCFGMCAGGFALAGTAFAADGLAAGSIGSQNAATVSPTSGRTPFNLTKGNFTFSKKCAYTTCLWVSAAYVNGRAPSSTLCRVTASDPTVIGVELRTSGSTKYAVVTPKKAGRSKVTYIDQYKRKRTFTFIVKKDYFAPALKKNTYGHSGYGTKCVTINTLPYASVSVAIGSERVSAKAGCNGLFTRSLKKDYRIGTKFKATVRLNGATWTYTSTVASTTYVSRIGKGSRQSICRYKCYVPVRICNLHRGDTVTLYAGGYSYTRHIYSNYSNYDMMINTKYRNGCYSSLRVVVKNKFGQTLDSRYRYLNWR